jgi:nucleoid DNA-binding protein
MARKPNSDTAVDGDAPADAGEGKSPAGDLLRMKDFLDRVTEANGGKRTGVRQIVELTLAALGDALEKGEQINLAPFGRARVTRRDDAGEGANLTIRLRRVDPAARKKPSEEGVAEPAEAS